MFIAEKTGRGFYENSDPFSVNVNSQHAYIKAAVCHGFGVLNHTFANVLYSPSTGEIGIELLKASEPGAKTIAKVNGGRQATIGVAGTLKLMGITIGHQVQSCTVRPFPDGRAGFIIQLPKHLLPQGEQNGTPTGATVYKHAIKPTMPDSIVEGQPARNIYGELPDGVQPSYNKRQLAEPTPSPSAGPIHNPMPALQPAAQDAGGIPGVPAAGPGTVEGE